MILNFYHVYIVYVIKSVPNRFFYAISNDGM